MLSAFAVLLSVGRESANERLGILRLTHSSLQLTELLERLDTVEHLDLDTAAANALYLCDVIEVEPVEFLLRRELIGERQLNCVIARAESEAAEPRHNRASIPEELSVLLYSSAAGSAFQQSQRSPESLLAMKTRTHSSFFGVAERSIQAAESPLSVSEFILI